MRNNINIGIVLALALIIFSTGPMVQGLESHQLIQIEGFQEAELISAREQIVYNIRIKKQVNSNPGTVKITNKSFISDHFKKDRSQNFSYKNPLFIRHCSLLI